MDLKEKITTLKNQVNLNFDILTYSWFSLIATLEILSIIKQRNFFICTLLIAILVYFIYSSNVLLLSLIKLNSLIETNTNEENPGDIIGVLRLFNKPQVSYYKNFIWEYLRSFPYKHPIYMISLIGLYLLSNYDTSYLKHYQNSLTHIPVLGNAYSMTFNLFSLTLLFLLLEFIPFIKEKIIKIPLTIFTMIYIPIILVGIVTGIVFFITLPVKFVVFLMYHNASVPYLYDHLLNWFSNLFNFMNVLLIPVVLITIFRIRIIKSFNEKT